MSRRFEADTVECPVITDEEARRCLDSRKCRDYGSNPLIRPDNIVTPPLELVELEEELQAVPKYVPPENEPTVELWPGARRGEPRR